MLDPYKGSILPNPGEHRTMLVRHKGQDGYLSACPAL